MSVLLDHKNYIYKHKLFIYTISMDRFWAKVDKTSSCWNWTGCFRGGYGGFWLDGRVTTAHRVAYAQLVGPVPFGLVLDHTCQNVKCVNPDHLEPITQKENVRRGSKMKHGKSPDQSKYTDKKFLLYIENERFKLEKNKSGLVNKLLEIHYSGAIKEYDSLPPIPQKPKDTSSIKFCQHGSAVGLCKFGCKK